MPGCAAIGCNNRSEKGYSMKCFPRDPKLRRIWRRRVGRANWEPSKNSFLCHVHFEPDQWIQTPNGRIRLKKDAIPSIFTETSTRKSPKKRRITQEFGENETDDSEGEYDVEYLEDNQYPCSIASKVQYEAVTEWCKTMPKYIFAQTNSSEESTGDRRINAEQTYHVVTERELTDLEKENIIVVSDANNREIGKLLHSENVIIVADENDKEIGQITIDEDTVRQREAQDACYDDLEAKLKQICDGDDESSPENQQESNTSSWRNSTDSTAATHRGSNSDRATNVRSGDKDDAGLSLDKEASKNLETIFTTRTSDEFRAGDGENMSIKSEKLSVDKMTKLSGNGILLGNLDELNGDTKGLSLIYGNKELIVTPEIRAAMKKKKRTRDEIMKRIEQTVSAMSDATDIQRKQAGRIDDETDHRLMEIKSESEDSDSKPTKFTIKVTEIDQDPTKNGRSSKMGDNCGVLMMHKRRNSSLAAIGEQENDDDTEDILYNANGSYLREKNPGNHVNHIGVHVIREKNFNMVKNNRRQLPSARHEVSDIETLFMRNKEFIHTEELDARSRNVKKRRRDAEETVDDNCDDKRSMPSSFASKSPSSSRDLEARLVAQQEVINKLTNQIIIYRELESKLVNMNLDLQVKNREVKMLKEKLEKKLVPSQERVLSKREVDNLINRVSQLEDANRKLTKRLNQESPDKKLAYQLKQKNDLIKELKWKLDKASKFLDRAERNAVTYKRRMLTMQASFRRQKLSEEKESQFKELLVDNAKHEFSESALRTAMDIKNTCGIKCYEKLLTYEFPLPSLRTLRRRFMKELPVEEDWGDSCINTESMNESIPDDEEESKIVSTPIERHETEVTGTVQDIFEESNEASNSSELGEQFISQLQNSA